MFNLGPIRSKKYRDGSRGQPCTLRIAGVICSGPETTVFCHIHDRHAGKGQKASDTSGADGCFACHEVFDRRAPVPGGGLLSREDRLFYALRGMQETIENRVRRGLVVVPLDLDALASERKVKPRKPVEQRAKITQRADPWPPKGSRKIPTRARTDA